MESQRIPAYTHGGGDCGHPSINNDNYTGGAIEFQLQRPGSSSTPSGGGRHSSTCVASILRAVGSLFLTGVWTEDTLPCQRAPHYLQARVSLCCVTAPSKKNYIRLFTQQWLAPLEAPLLLRPMHHFQESWDIHGGSGLSVCSSFWLQIILFFVFFFFFCLLHLANLHYFPGYNEGLIYPFIYLSIYLFLLLLCSQRGRKGDVVAAAAAAPAIHPCLFFLFIFFPPLLDAWAFLRMQGEICGDTWSTDFPAHIDPGAPGDLEREKADSRSMLGLGCWFGLCVCVRVCERERLCVRASSAGVCSPAKAMVHCAGCERPILDRFLLNVLDRAWHVKCVQCCECKCNLTEKCFSREGRLYCKNDFFR